MALERIQFETTVRPILSLLESWSTKDEHHGGLEHRLNFAPEYQRESVWTLDQRVNLIKSFMQGLPTGVIFLNSPSGDYMRPHNVVDGKQRLETLVMWLHGDFAVPREWFNPKDVVEGLTHGCVCWDELTQAGQRVCMFDWAMAVYETKLPESAEPELYERINYGGTPHEPLVR